MLNIFCVTELSLYALFHWLDGGKMGTLHEFLSGIGLVKALLATLLKFKSKANKEAKN